MDGGRVVREGHPETVLTPDCVNAVWGYPASHATDTQGRRLLA
jgi:ABC-type cobalamin/Fe3+-siderophores transport system ATPase subunit